MDFSLQSGKSDKRAIAGLITGGIMLVLSSWIRACLAGIFMVDLHALQGAAALFIYLFFGLGLAIYSISLYRFWKQETPSPQKIRRLAYLFTALFSLMAPMLSNDVFALLTYGDLANKGFDLFVLKRFEGQSFFELYHNPNAGDGAFAYGPVCIVFMRAATFFFPQSLAGALITYKLITLFWAALFIEAGYKIALSSGELSKPFLFVALNPVFLLEGAGQQHIDLFCIAMTLWAVYFVLNNKAAIAVVPIALAAAMKMSYVLLFPYAFIALYLQHPKLSSLALKSLAGLALAGITLVLLYLPFYSSLNTFLVPFQSLLSQVPTKSLVEVFGDIIFYATQLVHPNSSGISVTNTMAGDTAIAAQKQQIWTVLIFIFRFIAVGTSIILAFRFFKKGGDKASLTSLYLRLLLLFLLFYSHVIYPWYLLMILPFVWFEHDTRFMLWLFVLTCFCNAQGIMCSVDRHSWVYPLVVPLIALNVFIFIWRFRSNFLPKD